MLRFSYSFHLQLQSQLSSTEKQLQEARVQLQLQKSQLEAEHTSKITGAITYWRHVKICIWRVRCCTALVEEIYRAQKQRDVAVMKRLRAANDERDEALLKLRHLHNNLRQ